MTTFGEHLAAMTEAQLREMIELKEKQMDELEHRYGTGIRPSWVGEEIGILSLYKNWYKEELARRVPADPK